MEKARYHRPFIDRFRDSKDIYKEKHSPRSKRKFKVEGDELAALYKRKLLVKMKRSFNFRIISFGTCDGKSPE